jgi:hypothetical protein
MLFFQTKILQTQRIVVIVVSDQQVENLSYDPSET